MIYLIIIGILILLEELVEAFYRKRESYRCTLGGVERFCKVPYNIDICNIGSGPGLYAISYDKCDEIGFNFSTAPQNYKYGFRILKKFRNHIKKGAIIIIIIMCPLSFGDNKDYKRKDYSDRYYGLLPKEDIDNYSLKRFYIARHPFMMRAFRKIRGILVKERIQSQETKSEIPAVVNTWKREFELKDLLDPSQGENHRNAYKEKIEILQSGLDYCYSKGWKPVFVTPPIPQKTRSYIGDDFLQEFVYQNVDILLNNNPCLQYYNYFDEKLPDDFFMNDIFMNEKGKMHFSEELFRDLNKTGELGEWSISN